MRNKKKIEEEMDTRLPIDWKKKGAGTFTIPMPWTVATPVSDSEDVLEDFCESQRSSGSNFDSAKVTTQRLRGKK